MCELFKSSQLAATEEEKEKEKLHTVNNSFIDYGQDFIVDMMHNFLILSVRCLCGVPIILLFVIRANKVKLRKKIAARVIRVVCVCIMYEVMKSMVGGLSILSSFFSSFC